MGSSVATQSENTRRWQRQPVDLPLGVVTGNGQIGTVVPGRAIEISEGGMALYAGIDLEPGDLMAVEFRGPSNARVAGAIRSRSGYCFGLEFLTPVLPGGESTSGARLAEFALEQGSLAQTELLVPAADASHQIKLAEKAAAAYALLAQVLRSEGKPAKALIADHAVALFLRMKDMYRRQT
jgi:hypothetical protein